MVAWYPPQLAWVTVDVGVSLVYISLGSLAQYLQHRYLYIRTSANRKCHGLLVLKQSGVNQPSLVQMYKAQIVPTISHSAPAWYPFLSKYQQDELEKCQKLALRIIYPEVEHYEERLLAASLPLLNELLKLNCHNYIQQIVESTDHPLRPRLAIRDQSIRHSSRRSDKCVYIQKCRTEKRNCAILVNHRYNDF